MPTCIHTNIHACTNTYQGSLHKYIPGVITLSVTGAALPALLDTPEEVGLGTNAQKFSIYCLLYVFIVLLDTLEEVTLGTNAQTCSIYCLFNKESTLCIAFFISKCTRAHPFELFFVCQGQTAQCVRPLNVTGEGREGKGKGGWEEKGRG
jgi:hypothetical protein